MDVINTSSKIYFFTLGGETLVLPLILLKLRRKKIVIIKAASTQRMLVHENKIVSLVAGCLERCGQYVCDILVIYSSNMKDELYLDSFDSKIRIAPHNIYDETMFSSKISEKEKIIGYIGRLNHEKGILKFVDAMDIFLRYHDDYSSVILGDGALKEEVNSKISSFQSQRIVSKGWVDHKDLPHYLDKMKFLIVPSYTEGLPNVIIEAMAAETIVIASPVGAIPDVVIDEVTGFLLDDNDPHSIVERLEYVLYHDNIDTIAKDAHELVKNKFTLDIISQKYAEIIKELD
jgi:glycosyltransferase involved in cell wall biosynthesis